MNNNREEKSVSLLDGADVETQAKDSPFRIALRVVLMTAMFLLLSISYFFNFSVNKYPKGFKTYFAGCFSNSVYYGANSCDLIVIKSCKDVDKLQIGDIVCFVTNTEEGSGKLVNKNGKVLELKISNGTIKNISSVFIVGKQVKVIPVLGFIFAFLDSYYGVIILTIMILLYASILTFSRINYENTVHGKKLYKRFRYKQKEERERKKLLKQVENIDGIDLYIAQMLSGSFEENKEKFLTFDYKTKGKLKEKYKYILRELHDGYLTKDEYSREEKRHITAIIELMVCLNEFDLDMEYMLIDLALRVHLCDFKTEDFKTEAISFIDNVSHKSDLLNFGSVFYILVYRNSKIRDGHIKEVALRFKERLISLSEEPTSLDNNLALGILNLLN